VSAIVEEHLRFSQGVDGSDVVKPFRDLERQHGSTMDESRDDRTQVKGMLVGPVHEGVMTEREHPIVDVSGSSGPRILPIFGNEPAFDANVARLVPVTIVEHGHERREARCDEGPLCVAHWHLQKCVSVRDPKRVGQLVERVAYSTAGSAKRRSVLRVRHMQSETVAGADGSADLSAPVADQEYDAFHPCSCETSQLVIDEGAPEDRRHGFGQSISGNSTQPSAKPSCQNRYRKHLFVNDHIRAAIVNAESHLVEPCCGHRLP